VENLIVFVGYGHQLPIVLGMFGKENLEYLSEFNAKNFHDTKTQIYYHKGLKSKIYFYNHPNDFLTESDDFFKTFNNCIFFIEELGSRLMEDKVNWLKAFNPSIKRAFIWHYAEVFETSFMKRIEDIGYDIILSGSKRPGLDSYPNFYFDLLFPFRYFRYYIGYYYLEDLVKAMPLPKYDKSKPKLFSYIRAYQNSGWRTTILDDTPKIRKMLNPKDSANDAYDLVYPKHKHFEAIYDYLYCNYNLIFETLAYTNNGERFITEKTFKGLFFGKPILLVACYETLNELRDMGFYLLNFDFVENLYSAFDVQKSITLFAEWLDNASDDEIEEKYNQSLEKSIQNRHKLMEYLNDYSEMENIFKKLLLN
jgi:hypothetical protein